MPSNDRKKILTKFVDGKDRLKSIELRQNSQDKFQDIFPEIYQENLREDLYENIHENYVKFADSKNSETLQTTVAIKNVEGEHLYRNLTYNDKFPKIADKYNYEIGMNGNEKDFTSEGSDEVQDDIQKNKMGKTTIEENEKYEKSDLEYYDYKKKIYKTMFLRILYVFLLFCVSLYIQCYSIILSDTYYETGETPLKDRLHEVIPNGENYINASIINGCIGVLFTITFIRFGIFCPFLLSLAILLRTIFLLSLIYLIRSLFIYVTTLPCPIRTCVPVEKRNFWENLYTGYLIVFAKVYECTDLIISGHTAFTTTLLNFWIVYEQSIYAKLGILLFAIVIFFFIIISKFHYTVDVLIGYMFASAIFYLYHGCLDIAAKRYAIYGSFKQQTNYPKSFLERVLFLDLLIQAVASIEALKCRLDISLEHDRKWPAFCPCESNTSKNFFIKSCGSNGEVICELGEHFYHSYAGTGVCNMSTVNYIVQCFKLKLLRSKERERKRKKQQVICVC